MSETRRAVSKNDVVRLNMKGAHRGPGVVQ